MFRGWGVPMDREEYIAPSTMCGAARALYPRVTIPVYIYSEGKARGNRNSDK